MLDARLPLTTAQPGRLHEAMRYSVLGGGKRIRPRLVYATGEVLGIPSARLDAPAAAVEFIHAYSLVHDDLPAMDDDALRRGQPTTHIAFDEATAILAGDALQALAFEMLADASDDATPAMRTARLATLARACGACGMVGGQALDMASEDRPVTRAGLERIHQLKTGALLRACVLLAADSSAGRSAAGRAALDTFATRIGLAFQVRDDVLDIEASTQTLGKSQGADIAHSKATYPDLLGLSQAKVYAERLYDEAIEALACFGARGQPLRAIAAEIVKRGY